MRLPSSSLHHEQGGEWDLFRGWRGTPALTRATKGPHWGMGVVSTSERFPDRTRDYVPISQDARYFFCSAVNVSIATPMPASLSRAISLSIASGTGYTFFSSCL